MKNLWMALLILAATMVPVRAQEKAGAPPMLRNADVVKLVALGVSEDTVIAVIRETAKRAFDTSPPAVAALRASGVPPRVVALMQGQPVPARAPAPDERIERAKFDNVYRAARAVDDAVATNVLDRQLEPLIQAWKAESAAVMGKSSTRAERELASKYEAARAKFEQGLAQRDLSRYDAWKSGASMLEEANKTYLGR